MLVIDDQHLELAPRVLKRGGVIAYPTEAVYGLGCDPRNERALDKLLRMKNRILDKGLILIASNFTQLEDFVADLPEDIRQKIFATWPGPVTWIVPAKPKVSAYVTGGRDTIAVRVSAHPLVQQLCELYQGAIISTSANLSGEPPIKHHEQVIQKFRAELDAVVVGATGNLAKPTEIREALYDRIIRPG